MSQNEQFDPKELFRFGFSDRIDFHDVEETFLLSVIAAECIHGESLVRLDTRHAMDAESRKCVIDATTPVGRDVAKLFVGFLGREFGELSFSVERVDHSDRQPAPAEAA